MEPPEEKSIILPPDGLAEDVLVGEERVYRFADSLEDGQVQERRDKAPERPEVWVVFSLAGESYGLPVTHVREMLRVVDITRVPHAPEPVRGVTNMRGKVIPVVDLRTRLGLAKAAVTPESRILVSEARGRVIGLLVDVVEQILAILPQGIQPPPPDVMTEQSDYIVGVYQGQDHMLILLDVERVLLIKESAR